MNEVLSLALTALRARITRVFPAQVRKALEPLSDEQIWWRPNESSNSIGNLVLHLSGSLDYYLNRNLGGLDFTRDRPGEFNERREIPKAGSAPVPKSTVPPNQPESRTSPEAATAMPAATWPPGSPKRLAA